MLRVLFDKNVPYSLKTRLSGCYVRTAEDEGWGQISNGELIACAERAEYQIFLTCDHIIPYQQNLTHRKISLVVLGSNIWPSVKLKLSEIKDALGRSSPGSFDYIEIPPPPKRRMLRPLPG